LRNKEGAVFAIQVSVNGVKIATAGIEDWGLIHADVMANRARGPDEEDCYELNVGGLAQQVTPGKHEHVRWGRHNLTVGDEITIRLLNTCKTDEPIKRFRSDKTVQENPFTEDEIRQMKWETYIELKKIFEPNNEAE
jgi:hypothetical protein